MTAARHRALDRLAARRGPARAPRHARRARARARHGDRRRRRPDGRRGARRRRRRRGPRRPPGAAGHDVPPGALRPTRGSPDPAPARRPHDGGDRAPASSCPSPRSLQRISRAKGRAGRARVRRGLRRRPARRASAACSRSSTSCSTRATSRPGARAVREDLCRRGAPARPPGRRARPGRPGGARPARPSWSSRSRGCPRAPGPAASSSRCSTRTASAGTTTRSAAGSPRSTARGRPAAGRSGRTGCRQRSPRATTCRHRGGDRLGRGSPRSTARSAEVRPSPVVELNRAAAIGMADTWRRRGARPARGAGDRLDGSSPYHAVRAGLLERDGAARPRRPTGARGAHRQRRRRPSSAGGPSGRVETGRTQRTACDRRQGASRAASTVRLLTSSWEANVIRRPDPRSRRGLHRPRAGTERHLQ